AVIALWSGIAWIAKGVALRRGRRTGPAIEQLDDAMQGASADPPPAGDASRPASAVDAARDRVVSR
ncbi:MAG: hypothetical protein ACM3IK_14995, partial [Sphingomonadaceae bacterium]